MEPFTRGIEGEEEAILADRPRARNLVLLRMS